MRPHIVAYDAEVNRRVFVELFRKESVGGEIKCRTTWRRARGGCAQHPPCPAWFSKKGTMIVRAAVSGLVLIMPPAGFR